MLNLNQIFESFLRNLTADGTAEVFLWIVIVFFIAPLFMTWKGMVPRFTAYAPTLLTSLGILGTFTGIVIGLLNFDPDPAQLDASIGKLLDGLKTAFITSIAGMGLGILFKLLSAMKPAEDESESEVGPADILAKLDEQTRLLAATRDAVAGSEESSLAGQMKLLRTDLANWHRDDRQALDGFVQQLVAWQEHYRRQLAQLHALYDQSVQSITKVDSAVAHIAESSSSIPDSMEKLSGIVDTRLDEQTRLLAATRDAVAGSEESSLAGQMKLLRTDLTDQHRDNRDAFEAFASGLWEQLKGVSDMLSRSAGEKTQLLEKTHEALADLVGQLQRQHTELTAQHRDFARWLRDQFAKLSQRLSRVATETTLSNILAKLEDLPEQFGDNFKRLDASVQKLVDCQEHYRRQLAQLHALYDQSVQSITKVDSAVAHIAESSSSIPDSMERLADIVETASHQLAELERHLAAFAQLRDRAVEAVPQVQAHVEAITRDITASVHAASEHYQALLENSDSYLKAQDDKAQEILATFTDAGVRVQRDVQSVQQQVAGSIQRMQSQVEASVNEVLVAQNQAVSQGVEHLRSRTEEAVNAQLEALDQLMNQEIERVMNEMGRALAQIAGKFTDDYSELTEAMRGIVERGGRGR